MIIPSTDERLFSYLKFKQFQGCLTKQYLRILFESSVKGFLNMNFESPNACPLCNSLVRLHTLYNVNKYLNIHFILLM